MQISEANVCFLNVGRVSRHFRWISKDLLFGNLSIDSLFPPIGNTADADTVYQHPGLSLDDHIPQAMFYPSSSSNKLTEKKK